MKSKKHAERALAVSVQADPPPEAGKTIFEREIPSDPALVTPLILRALECLKKESLIQPGAENKVGLCFEEALQNAVLHGNGKDFGKKVRLRIRRGRDAWDCVVSDEGSGFDPAHLRDPLKAESIWGESGRGLIIITHFMDRTEFFNGGNTVVMTKKL